MNKQRLTKLEKFWIMYDVGNSAFSMLISTLIPIYFKNVAATMGISSSNSTAYFSYAISISTIIVAILGPVLGTFADNKGLKKPLFTLSMMLGIIGCAALAVPSGIVIFLSVFVFAKVGYSTSLIFYDSMLVDVTTDERMDTVSSRGYAWGYLGSCVPFIASLVLVMKSDLIGLSPLTAMGIAFVLNAVWWLLVTLPLLKNYKQVYYVSGQGGISESLKRLSKVFGELRNNKVILYFLLAFFFYIDGVYTIIEMATSYGKDVGLTDNSMLLALLLTQVVAAPCAMIFGRLTKRFKTRNLISVCIGAYCFVALFALQLDTAFEFWFLATFVGVFQGAIQALSRSYFARIIPKQKSSEYFGIYDIFGKGASFAGTMMMGVSTQIFGTSKAGVVGIALMFVFGFVVFRLQCRKSDEAESQTNIK